MSRANQIAMHYIGGLRDAMRKKNTEGLKSFGKSDESVEPDDMGDNADLGDDELSAMLEGQGSAENEMGDNFAGDGKDVGAESDAPLDDKDQATMKGDPAGIQFGEKKSSPEVDLDTEGNDPRTPNFKKKQKTLYTR